MLDSLATAAREEVYVEKRYETFIGMIRSSAEAAQTRTQGDIERPPFFRRFGGAKLIAFRHFWSNENSHNYIEYKMAERNLNYSCKTKKIESWRRGTVPI
jgi:hypothetical protein